jgi:hypothetical protein
MYFYWRIQKDLDCLGEVITFHDPRFIRSFQEWIRRNTTGLQLAEGLYSEQNLQPCLN